MIPFAQASAALAESLLDAPFYWAITDGFGSDLAARSRTILIDEEGSKRAQKRVLLDPRWLQGNSTNSCTKNGGDDGTRTRGLCRDSNNLQDHGDCQNTRKPHVTSHFVVWVVGWRQLRLSASHPGMLYLSSFPSSRFLACEGWIYELRPIEEIPLNGTERDRNTRAKANYRRYADATLSPHDRRSPVRSLEPGNRPDHKI